MAPTTSLQVNWISLEADEESRGDTDLLHVGREWQGGDGRGFYPWRLHWSSVDLRRYHAAANEGSS